MNQRFVYKLLTVAVLLILSAAAVGMWITDELFVPLSIGVFGASSILMSSILLDIGSPHRRAFFVIGCSVVLSVFFRFLTFGFPASLIGMDTDSFALLARLTMLEGYSPPKRIIFYSRAPIFNLYLSNFSFISGLEVPDAVGIYSVLFGLTFPLLGAWLGFLIAPARKYDVASLGTVFIAVIPSLVRHSYWPMPQMLGTLLLIFMFILLIRGTYTSQSHSLIMILSLCSLMFIHKITLQMFAVTITGVLVFNLVAKGTDRDDFELSDVSTNLVMLGGVFSVIQWVYVTDYVDNVISWINGFLTSEIIVSQSRTHPPFGTPLEFGALDIFHHQSQAILFLAVGGVAWLIAVYWFSEHKRIRTLLVLVGVLTALTVVSGLKATSSEAPNPIRFYMAVATPLVVLVSIVAIRFIRDENSTLRRTVTGVLILLLVFQVFSAYAYPAYPGDTRFYLTSSEYSAKEFGATRVPSEISTDWYYSQHTVGTGSLNNSSSNVATGFDDVYVGGTKHYLNGSISEGRQSYVAYRTDIEVYWTESNAWSSRSYTLQWNPETKLRASYSKIYSSNDVDMYRKNSSASVLN